MTTSFEEARLHHVYKNICRALWTHVDSGVSSRWNEKFVKSKFEKTSRLEEVLYSSAESLTEISYLITKKKSRQYHLEVMKSLKGVD